ncbi:Conserved hypothetical protein (plasmid) [Clostridium acetobutylicum EA 2018]|uniref:Uncharacterized protein n=1 Tax=Clostridium acetobutylicum (strain ATCC 824 / DSM 792 / JCM 1419 / IAM 19013 / LMG 5710 / NBRC 13948 / NRRL B-527 / VKM B-1787 / 2291 / W) TaxID=272562 RepID=Q97TK8_CLOAB|nr:Hypothetical protein CA_P0092 [Clostridium acetobutylicum ATCC 824]ADZ22874.1 Conserved hypothetical protein [Clostridium acetobutylicum EA 2018]AEI34834.1 hypothetical protein SMB_P091 [Clostridium acetobutylicum DSM 1731]AWV82381.1 hypothetical protein DK921_20025 [Clostridium acetobutylicum]PSM04417.1 hypothetical protein C7T89_18620 [Clostridium sp. NJ4]
MYNLLYFLLSYMSTKKEKAQSSLSLIHIRYLSIIFTSFLNTTKTYLSVYHYSKYNSNFYKLLQYLPQRSHIIY